MYMVVDGKHYNDKCCYDYGNAETNGKDNGKGSTMEAVYFGSDTEWGGPGQNNGPWVAADLDERTACSGAMTRAGCGARRTPLPGPRRIQSSGTSPRQCSRAVTTEPRAQRSERTD